MVLIHISPDWISVAESQGSPIDTLYEEEIAYLKKAGQKRRQEFAAVRHYLTRSGPFPLSAVTSARPPQVTLALPDH